MSNASYSSHTSEQSHISQLPPSQHYRDQPQSYSRLPYNQHESNHSHRDSDVSQVNSNATPRSQVNSTSSNFSEKLDHQNVARHHPSPDHSPRQHRQVLHEAPFAQSRGDNSPRASPQRTPRRRDPAPDNEALPSLDDYEAMLQQMTSPGLGPSGARSPRSRQDREPRTARDPRKQPQRPRPRQHDESLQSPKLAPLQEEPQRMAVVSNNNSNNNHNVNSAPLEDQRSEAERLRERKNRRRSSLPTNLQAPSWLLPPKRRSSGHLSPTDAPVNELLSTTISRETLPSIQPPAPSLNPDDMLPSRSQKRYSWEDDSIATREDLLAASQPSNVRRSGGSWADHLSPVKEEFKDQDKGQDMSRPDSDAPVVGSAIVEPAASQANVEPIPETLPNMPPLPPQPPRSATPSGGRSRSTTPVPGIQPPPGVAPPSSPSQARKVLPSSGGKRGARSGSNASATAMLLPGNANTRPRAGSAASIGSMNSFTLDGVLTPPPPSSPLPSLPSGQKPSSSSSPKIGLGIGNRGRKSSGSGSRELVLPPPQVVLEGSDAVSLPTPSSSVSMSPDLGHNAVNGTGPQQTTPPSSSLLTTGSDTIQVARLRKRVSLLEKELANTEIQLSSRMRDSSELQFKVEHLTVERDTLQSRIKLLEEHVKESSKRSDLDRQRESIEMDRASLKLQHDQELKDAVKQIQDEKEALFEAMMERQDRSREEMSQQMEALRQQLMEREQELRRAKSELEDQQSTGNGFMISQSRQSEEMNQEITRLQTLQGTLEQELTNARNEIHRLQSLVADQKQSLSKDQRAREELEVKVEALMLVSNDLEQAKRDMAEYEDLKQQVEQLRYERATQEEKYAALERELNAFTERSQQEEAQYRTLQDTIQRLSSKITRMESQHAIELDGLQRTHDDEMARVDQNHANALADMSEQHRSMAAAEIKELQARGRVLYDRLQDETHRNDQIETRLFQLEKAQASHEAEKETLDRANKSLERHLSMQRLQEQENQYKIEELERDNVKLRAILAQLNMVASSQSGRKDGEIEGVNEDDDERSTSDLYEKQQRQWAEQTEMLERKLAKVEAEARSTMEQNLQLKVELDLLGRGNSLDDRSRSRSP
ncbi:hypothetical protein BGZ94_009856 [Podila epigama]|nr:hypothetical protein BGZ94_009856 [Podila epigama]